MRAGPCKNQAILMLCSVLAVTDAHGQTHAYLYSLPECIHDRQRPSMLAQKARRVRAGQLGHIGLCRQDGSGPAAIIIPCIEALIHHIRHPCNIGILVRVALHPEAHGHERPEESLRGRA